MTTRSTSPSATSRSPINALVKLVLRNTIRNPLRFVGLILLGYIAFIALSNIIDGDYTLELFVRQLIFGLSQGSIYALIALGYTLVYGILFMINFAHGEVFMAGAYFGFFALYAMGESGLLQSQTALALVLAVVIGALGSAMVAVLLERIAYRPLRSAPRLVPLITAIGASITLQQLFLRLFGASARRYPDVSLYVLPDVFKTLECSVIEGVEVCRGMDLIRGLYTVDVLGLTLRLRPITFIVFFISLAMMGGLWFIIQRTKTGRAMRAVAEDKSTALLMGINVDRVIVTTFILGALLAGAGGVLFALIPGNGQITPTMGFLPGIKAFTAAVVGGIGNIPGAMFGGLFLGVIESIGPSLLGLDHQLRDVIAFGMLVFVLIFRPTGIFGEVLSEKKV
jgi:branched-chain amino acid transport system permease protein